MAATILHYGVDSSFRVAVLTSAGFKVEDCASSLSQFADALQKLREIQAVVLSESDEMDGGETTAASLARSTCEAPVILFRSSLRNIQYPNINLIIPTLTEPSVWLKAIRGEIDRTRALLAESKAIRKEPRSLVQDISDVRTKSAAARKRAAQIRANSDLGKAEKSPSKRKGQR